MTTVSGYMRISSVDVYRSGNASGPRLSALRLKDTHPDDPDIETYADHTGAVLVRASSGGVSVWERPDRRWRKIWMLPAGSAYPTELKLWSDIAPHWIIAPATDMFLLKYVSALDTLSLAFVRVE
jgi:hypothetical protein